MLLLGGFNLANSKVRLAYLQQGITIGFLHFDLLTQAFEIIVERLFFIKLQPAQSKGELLSGFH